MRIALISFEYPPAVAVGGIGTYTFEASRMLARAGLDVEVFSAGSIEGTFPSIGRAFPIHRIQARDRTEFRERLLPIFRKVHHAKAFDLLESPEIGAEGLLLAQSFPEVARVIKLHTPTFLVSRHGHEPPTLIEKLRFTLGGLCRGRWNRINQQTYDLQADLECQWTLMADEVASPSLSISTILTREWPIDVEKVSCYPLPFSPSDALMKTPVAHKLGVVGFLGRLEPRKGIIELTQAMVKLLKQNPNLQFRLIGPSWPFKKTDMKQWIISQLGSLQNQVTFVGAVTPEQIPSELGKCDAMVLPSRWESFGLVCPESMCSGRVVIGSTAGGMAEMIEHGRTGLLVEPYHPDAIVSALQELIRNPGKIGEMAEAGRRSIMDKLSPSRILPLQVTSYRRAIARARLELGRSTKRAAPCRLA